LFVVAKYVQSRYGLWKGNCCHTVSQLFAAHFSFWDCYCKLVETFHVVSECKTAVYFNWSLIHVIAQPVQLFWPLVTFSVASSNSLTDSDLQPLTNTEQDLRRHSFIQYYYIFRKKRNTIQKFSIVHCGKQVVRFAPIQ